VLAQVDSIIYDLTLVRTGRLAERESLSDAPLIIQTIRLYPSGAVWTDGPSNVSRLDPPPSLGWSSFAGQERMSEITRRLADQGEPFRS
jgi:hypothetical protein